MGMPETSVNHDHGFSGSEYKIRLSGQHGVVQAVSIPAPVKSTSQNNLGLSVLALDTRHHAATGVGVYNVRHQTRVNC